MKNIFKILSVSFIVLTVSVFYSCKKDNASGTHKVKFKAETSSDAKLSAVAYTNESGNVTNTSSLNSSSFASSELTIPSSVSIITFSANGNGASAGSTLKVQIYVDGNLVKENTGTGTVLTASTTYSF
ncbi:hypothetical protein IDJ77_12015 [Mucilaginibacter sp. ZT4R22]|uniref:Uncharacterized protein n=1 Tax=Mucilaginibacter pankratovii TaxID=2772110 RepID=A0ABR7WQD1_9SPHI|nr:hypothetical protein [Mucilaginibacter pankratovii]MBD1364535.1 hypothetical protein [Mucilaginibacter pankratovii]